MEFVTVQIPLELLLEFINGAERIASIRLHELTAGQAEIFFEQFKNSPFSEPCKTSWI